MPTCSWYIEDTCPNDAVYSQVCGLMGKILALFNVTFTVSQDSFIYLIPSGMSKGLPEAIYNIPSNRKNPYNFFFIM